MLTGCIFPYEIDKGRFNKESISFIQVDATSKADMLAIMGNPDRLVKSDNVWIYNTHGSQKWFVGDQFHTFETPGFLIVRWNDLGIVEDYDIIWVKDSCENRICVGRRNNDVYDYGYFMMYDSLEQDSRAKQFDVALERCANYFYVTTSYIEDFFTLTLDRVRVI